MECWRSSPSYISKGCQLCEKLLWKITGHGSLNRIEIILIYHWFIQASQVFSHIIRHFYIFVSTPYLELYEQPFQKNLFKILPIHHVIHSIWSKAVGLLYVYRTCWCRQKLLWNCNIINLYILLGIKHIIKTTLGHFCVLQCINQEAVRL